MNPLGVWQGWSQEIGRIVPGLGVWQRRALALFSRGWRSAPVRSISRSKGPRSGLRALGAHHPHRPIGDVDRPDLDVPVREHLVHLGLDRLGQRAPC
jgi:hypothetical protein